MCAREIRSLRCISHVLLFLFSILQKFFYCWHGNRYDLGSCGYTGLIENYRLKTLSGDDMSGFSIARQAWEEAK